MPVHCARAHSARAGHVTTTQYSLADTQRLLSIRLCFFAKSPRPSSIPLTSLCVFLETMEVLLLVGTLFSLLGAIVLPVHSEMFTALVHMEGLVELEGTLASELRGYIRREKDRLRELERCMG